MRNFYGLVVGEFGSRSFDVTPFNKLFSHSFVGRIPVNAKDSLNFRKQNAAQVAVLLSRGRYSIFNLSIVWHIVVPPPEEKPESQFGLPFSRSSAGPTF